jgi:hypothetical protein
MTTFHFTLLITTLVLSSAGRAGSYYSKTNVHYTQSHAKAMSLVKNNNGCNKYIVINGNKSWRKNKDKLNTNLNDLSKCKSVNIYKKITNVYDPNFKNNNIGLKSDSKSLKNGSRVTTNTYIKNSNIGNKYRPTKTNVGIQIEGNNVNLNNVDISNNVKIKDSYIW